LDDLQISQLSSRIWKAGLPREDLVARVSAAIREQIQAGELQRGTRLVGETELARQLGISRPTLREATRMLAQEGLIEIKHGVGTFVAEHLPHVRGSLDVMRSMSALIRAVGGEPRVRELKIEVAAASDAIAEVLGLSPRAPIAEISRVRLIDDRPLALGYEYIPLFDAEREYALVEAFDGGSIYEFMAKGLRRQLVRSEMAVTAVAAGKAQAERLELKPRAPLLLMREVHYDESGQRVLYSVNYHNSEVVDFSLMRTWVSS